MNGLSKESVSWLEIDENSAGQRIDNFLFRHLKGVPKSHIYRILRSGEVRVNKKRVDQTYRLQLGDLVRIPPAAFEAVDEVTGIKVRVTTGAFLMAAGVASLASAGWPAGLGCVMLFGAGIGLAITASNVFVGQARPARRAAAAALRGGAGPLHRAAAVPADVGGRPGARRRRSAP